MSNAVRIRVDAGDTGTSLIVNDPSDALDYLIHQGVSKSVAIKRKPDIGWSWEDLPLTIPWNGTKYTLEIVSNKVAKRHAEEDISKTTASASEGGKGRDLNCPKMVVRTRFDYVVESINEKFGDGYATKNPDLVKFLMVEISQEIQTRVNPGYN